MINCNTAVILAGGHSSRMSYNKEFIKDGDVYLVHKTIQNLKKYFDEVIVVTNNPHLYSNVIVLKDEIPNRGPVEGLRVALKASSSDYIYLMAVDMPNVDNDYIDSLKSQPDGYDIYATDNGFIQTFHAIYHKNCLNSIDKSKSLYGLTKIVNAKVTDFQHINSSMTGQEIFFNINTKADLDNYETNILSKKVKIEKYHYDEHEELLDEVVEEFPITLYINDVKYVTILCTPDSKKQLIIGYLNSNGMIDTFSDVISISISKNRVDVELKDTPKKSKEKILYSACGVGTEFHEKIDELLLDSLVDDVSIKTDEIYFLTKRLAQKSNLFMNTGGVHSALYLYEDTEIFKEDIGRHNAVDKIVGDMLMRRIPSKGVLVVSGRLSSEMVLKSLFAKIPIVVSRSAPTSLAIKLADKFGVTLVGFARGNKMNVYTHKRRIITNDKV